MNRLRECSSSRRQKGSRSKELEVTDVAVVIICSWHGHGWSTTALFGLSLRSCGLWKAPCDSSYTSVPSHLFMDGTTVCEIRSSSDLLTIEDTACVCVQSNIKLEVKDTEWQAVLLPLTHTH